MTAQQIRVAGRSAAGGRITIGDVADAARVSRATVSRVMNGLSTVDAELAKRVMATAEELGYAPSTVARSLALGRTQTIGLIVPELANRTFQATLVGLSHSAATRGYRVLVADSANDVAEEVVLARESRLRCDGLVLCSPRMPEEQLVNLLPELSPVVVLHRDSPRITAPVLAVDFATGIRGLVRHLDELGHRRIVYLSGPAVSPSNDARRHGLQTLPDGLSSDLDIVEISCGSTFSDGYAAREVVLAANATAVLAYNDLVAFGLLGALQEVGVKVPDQISVVGFDDNTFARYTQPALTTASIPQTELGEQAWNRLWALLSGEEPAHNIFYRPRLEIRSSTGPAPVHAPAAG